MENITRTIYGNNVQAFLFMDKALTYPEYSTLNQKQNIHKDLLPDRTARPSLSYLAWGNRGHKLAVGADGIPYTDLVPHSATDSALYGQLPFVAREETNDLSSVERARYAHRIVKEAPNGLRYAMYYLRRLDKTNVVPTMYYTQVSNNQEDKRVFTPTAANMNPTPPLINNEGTNLISADYVSVDAIMTLSFTESEITEMINVAKIFHNNERLAIMSELALCTGVDRMVSVAGTGGSGSSSFNEAIVVQIAAFASVDYSLVNLRRKLDIELDVGSIEPLFQVTPADSSNTVMTTTNTTGRVATRTQ